MLKTLIITTGLLITACSSSTQQNPELASVGPCDSDSIMVIESTTGNSHCESAIDYITPDVATPSYSEDFIIQPATL